MHRRRGFTLMEIMIVFAIIGMIAAVSLPRISFYFEPPSALLQRSIEEARNLALGGVSIRFLLKPARDRDSHRGEIVTEALVQQEVEQDSLSAFLGTANNNATVLVWKPVKLTYPPAGDGWRLEPDIIYFYTDGSCTPAKISWLDPNVSGLNLNNLNNLDRDKNTRTFLLTVTGYCFDINDTNGR